MKFKGTPNLYVRFASKYVRKVTGKNGIMFDSDGMYETENHLIVRILSQHFETVAEPQESASGTKAEPEQESGAPGEKIYRCKKCDFTASDPLALGRHARTHKKEGSR